MKPMARIDHAVIAGATEQSLTTADNAMSPFSAPADHSLKLEES